MNLYVIRRPSGWGTPDALAASAARSRQVGDEEMPADIRWIRSYVVHERADIPATDIFEVADTVVVRPDPVDVAAHA